MSENDQKPINAYLWRGGKKIEIKKSPNSFTVRLKKGTTPASICEQTKSQVSKNLFRQRLTEFEVEADKLDRVMDFVRAGDDVLFASHVYEFVGDGLSRWYLMDDITVQFNQQPSDKDIEEIIATYGLEIVRSVKGMDRCYVLKTTAASKENPIKLANRLVEGGNVDFCEPNIAIASQNFHVPTDSLFTEQWHLFHQGGAQLADSSHIRATDAWEITRGERSVVVAIMDDSVDTNHVDFSGPDKIIAPRDFQGRDFEPLPELPSDNHGTSCAGVAVAEENGQGVVGVAPGCALMPIRMTGFLDDDSIEDMFEWAMNNGASIMSCSWGPAAINFPLSTRQKTLFRRIATEGRNGKGCVIVFASGNANRPINDIVDEKGWPNNAIDGSTFWLDGYASNEHIIAVSACSSLGTKSAYSNWGAEISVCAPSNNGHPGIGSTITYPRITEAILGRGVVTTDRVGPSGYSTSDYTFDFGGTSSACPVVAGVAALILSANPELTAQEVREIMEMTADKIIDDRIDPQLGTAFGTYDENGHSKWFGFGRVNAAKAVAEAVRRLGGTEEQDELRLTSSPNVPIPDNNPEGVIDMISIEKDGIISDFSVSVDISHTYRGDLVVSLISPSNTTINLHSRQGGGTNDLKATYDIMNNIGLSTLKGEQLKGEWLLLVQDLARVDTGKLNSWEIIAKVGQDTSLLLEEAPGVQIPDNDANGINRRLETEEEGKIRLIEVSVDITHTYKSDLVVELIAPDGSSIILHNRSGGSANNVIETYTFANNANLQNLKGKAIQGLWTLVVKDLAGLDLGKLNNWSLKFIKE